MAADVESLKAAWRAAGLSVTDEEAERGVEGVKRLRDMARQAKELVRRETEPAIFFRPPAEA